MWLFALVEWAEGQFNNDLNAVLVGLMFWNRDLLGTLNKIWTTVTLHSRELCDLLRNNVRHIVIRSSYPVIYERSWTLCGAAEIRN